MSCSFAGCITPPELHLWFPYFSCCAMHPQPVTERSHKLHLKTKKLATSNYVALKFIFFNTV
jgi:hypothetical protein